MRDYRGTIIREHGGSRAQSGFSIVVTKQGFAHEVTWQAYHDTDSGLPEIGARIKTAHDDLVDVRWEASEDTIDSDVDHLWVCQEHGQGDCWHARVGREALPEVARRITSAVDRYRQLESQGE